MNEDELLEFFADEDVENLSVIKKTTTVTKTNENQFYGLPLKVNSLVIKQIRV